MSAGVPHGEPALSAVAQAESLKLVRIQVAGGCWAAFQEISTAILDITPEANCTTNRPIAFDLTPGEAADCTAFEEVIALAEERPAYLLADKGYDSDAIRASLRQAGIRS